jgi:hypothetical protein
VPTLAEVWDFLVGLKEATQAGFARTEAGFARIDVRLDRMQSDMHSMRSDMHRMERRLVHSDDRMSDFDSLEVGPRLDDCERRISRLEQRFT